MHLRIKLFVRLWSEMNERTLITVLIVHNLLRCHNRNGIVIIMRPGCFLRQISSKRCNRRPQFSSCITLVVGNRTYYIHPLSLHMKVMLTDYTHTSLCHFTALYPRTYQNVNKMQAAMVPLTTISSLPLLLLMLSISPFKPGI